MLKTAPMLTVMGAVFVLSHQPGDTFEELSFCFADKLAHIGLYLVMAATVMYALPDRVKRRRPLIASVVVILVCLLYGCLDEFHQSFIPDRYPSVGDIIADIVGSLLFCLLWFWHQGRAGSQS